MFPKVFSHGEFFLPTYGLLVSAGFLLGLWIAARLARRVLLDPETVTNLGIYAALAGLAGAKFLLLAEDFNYYRRNPGEIFSLSTLQAGGVFYGGLLAALATSIWYLRRKKLPGMAAADVFAPGVALGHALGRIGCFAAGCCWGVECRRPWAVTFTNPDASALVGVPLGVPLHPTQLYEAAAEALIFALLYWRFHKPHREGSIIGLYLVLYPAVRFGVEFLRAHEQGNPFGGPLTAAQWITLALLGAGFWALAGKRPVVSPLAR